MCVCVYYCSTYYKAVHGDPSRKALKACVFITGVPIIKLFEWGEGDSGGHVLRETTSRSLCGLVCPSRTSDRGRLCERRKGRRKGAREGACTGAATMPEPPTLRLILNAAALAAASPTLIFNDWKNAARLKRNESDWLICDGTPVASSVSKVCLGLPVGLQKKKSQKLAVHAGGGCDICGEKRNVLIVSVLLPIAFD